MESVGAGAGGDSTPPVLQTLVVQQLLSVQQPSVLKAVGAFHLLRILKVYVNNSNYWQRQGVLQLRVCTRVSRCHLQGLNNFAKHMKTS